MATTIRSGISDVVNTLQKIRNNTTVASQQLELSKLIGVFFVLWEQVILDQLDKNDADYKSAIASLSTADKAAKAALKDLKKVVEAIKTATAAAKAVDKVVNLVIKLVA